MRRIFGGLLAGLVLAVWLPFSASAAPSGEKVTKLTVQMSLLKSGALRVRETIVYDFGTESRRGIFRDIPLDFAFDDIQNVRVSRNGIEEATYFENSGEFLRIRIGDPEVTLTGVHTYTVAYSAMRPLTEVSDRPGELALSWDAVGDGWRVPITNVVVAVTSKYPFNDLKCSTGNKGSRGSCVRSDAGVFRAGPLQPGEGVTIFAPLKPGHGLGDYAVDAGATSGDESPLPDDFDVFVPEVGVSATEAPPWEGVVREVVSFAAGFISGAIGAFLLRRRRVKVPVQYEPPRGLSPLQLGASTIADGALQPSTIAGALLDLAERGWVTVSLPEDGDPQVEGKAGGRGALSEAEQVLLACVLQGQSGVVTLSDSYLSSQWDQLATVQELASESVALERHPSPGKLQNMWVVGYFAAFAAGLAAGIALVPVVAAALLGLGVGMLLFSTLVRWQLSTDELLLEAEAEGFRRLLATDAAALRIAYAERTGYEPAALAATLLPYAVVLGVEAEWLEAFPDLSPEDLDRFSGVSGLGNRPARRLRRFRDSSHEALRPPRSTGSRSGRSGVLTGIRSGRGFSNGRGFSGSRGFSRSSRGMGRAGGGRGGGGAGSW